MSKAVTSSNTRDCSTYRRRRAKSPIARAHVVLPVAGLLLVALGACSSQSSGPTSSSSGSGTSGKLVIAASASMSSLDPQGGSGLGFWSLLMNYGNVSEGLVSLDGQTSTLHPDLATSWSYVTPTVLRLKLRHGVAFQDGTPFNAAAVVANVNHIRSPKTAADSGGYWAPITAVRADDNYTVDITTAKPDPVLLRALPAMMMLSPKTITGSGDIGTHIIGTGPYEISSATASEIIVKRNPHYWGPKPPFSEVDVESISAASARVAALSTGSVDIGYDIPTTSVAQVPKIVASPDRDQVNWRINAVGGITADPRVREALNLAVNANQIRLALLGSKYSSPDLGQPVPPSVFGYNPHVSAYPYDPQKAHQLLQQAGVLGKTIEMVSTERYAQVNEFTQAAAQQIEAVGLHVQIKLTDNQSWLNDLLNTKASAPAVVLCGAGSELEDGGIVFGETVDPAGQISQFPFSSIPSFNAAYQASNTEVNPAKRLADLQAAMLAWHQANAYLSGYFADSIWGAQKNISWHVRGDNTIVFSTVRRS